MEKAAEQQQIFEIVCKWVLAEFSESEKSKTEMIDFCQNTVKVLKDFVEESELDQDVCLIEDMLPEVINSIVENN